VQNNFNYLLVLSLKEEVGEKEEPRAEVEEAVSPLRLPLHYKIN
jgi:hypothetical protein